MPESTSANDERKRTWRRWLALRAAAMLVGLSPFLAGEVLLRVGGWQARSPSVDPYVGFHKIQPLFTLAEDGRHLAVPQWRREFFEPEQFLREKPKNEYRIFCLGGSTVQGRPYSIPTSFTTWLELSLGAADETRQWEVINCGGVSYASYRLAPIMKECLGYEPDLFIIYSGHNEFLEDRSYKGIKESSAAAVLLHRTASHSRLYQWARSLRRPPAPERSTLPAEVDALLDYRGGLESYHRDPPWRNQVVEHYGLNIRRMIDMAQDAGVPLILVNPVSNIRDCPPFKVEDDATLTTADRDDFQTQFDAARTLAESQTSEAIERLDAALKIDSEHAAAWFLMGHCLLSLGEVEGAEEALLRAKDYDVCPLRMTESLHAELHAAALDTDTPLVDARRWFVDQAELGLVGDDALIDHVHPKIEGHQAIAALLVEAMENLEIIAPSEDWQARRRNAYRTHMREVVDEAYMARGKQKLEGLKRWAAGRAYKVRGKE